MQVLALCLVFLCVSCGTESARWLPDPNLDRDEDVLVIYVTDPHCPSKLEADDVRIELEEGVESITVTAHVPDNSGGACSASNPSARVEVDLLDPIGDRTLLDGSRSPAARPVRDFNHGGLPIATTIAG